MRFLIKPCVFALLIFIGQILFVTCAVHGAYQQTPAEAHADRGLQLAQAGDLINSEVELRRAVQLAPGNPAFLAHLGTVLAMERKLENSTNIFEQALKLDPSNLTVRRYLGANLWQLHRYAEAKQNLGLLLKQKPDDEPARLLLGMVLENMKDYAMAVKMLASVPAQVHERPESIAALARSYYHLGDNEQARSTLGELLTSGPQAILLGAQIADEIHDYETAEKLLASVTSDSSNQPTWGYRLALVQYHAKRFQDSHRTLLNLIASGYKTGEILNLLGWCYAKENQPQEAARALDEAISLDPAQESNYLDLTKVLLASRLLPAALDAAKRTTQRFPYSLSAFLMRGSVEMEVSQFTDAIASYTHAVTLDPGDPDSNLGLGEALFAAGMNQEATASFETCIRRFPKDARFKLQYALILLKEAETGNAVAETRAERLLTSALALDRSLPEARYQLGNLALKEGRTEEALENFDQAAKLDPKSPKVHFALSRVYRRLGRTEAASQEMNLYRKLKEAESRPAATPSPAGVSQN